MNQLVQTVSDADKIVWKYQFVRLSVKSCYFLEDAKSRGCSEKMTAYSVSYQGMGVYESGREWRDCTYWRT
jgi:hypothetical protein